MGCFRLFLASLVLASHMGAMPVNIGSIAVECFFVLSGFYIQLIISKKNHQKKTWVGNFFKSRLLRIFTPYWVIAITVIIITIMTHPYSFKDHLPFFNNATSLLAIFANIFILPSDTIYVLRELENCNSGYFSQLIVPPIWSVGMELSFYLIAPWLLTLRTTMLAVICLVALFGKIFFLYLFGNYLINLACGTDLFNGFFPLEIGIFLIGALLYRIYEMNRIPDINIWILMSILIIPVLFLDVSTLWGWYGYLSLVVCCLPFLFKTCKKSNTDRIIGELSYPFYLCHYYLCHDAFAQIITTKQITAHHSLIYLKFAIIEIIALLFSWIILIKVIRPIDNYRHKTYA